MSAISEYLDQIMNARFGVDVRDAIYNSISQCYSDVLNGVTIAESSSTQAAGIITNAQQTASNAQTLATNASTLVTSALSTLDGEKTAKFNQYDQSMQTRFDTIDSKITEINGRISAADTATGSATTAANELNNLTVSSATLSSSENVAVLLQTINGHKDIKFSIPRGEKGDSLVIKGPAYATLAALQAAVPAPNVGDMYNVGSSAPYNVWRYTGVSNEDGGWENQGAIGSSVENISSTDIDKIWNSISVADAGAQFLNQPGFKNIVSKIQTAISGKVSTEANKGLYPNADAEKVALIGSGSLSTTASTLIGAINELVTNKVTKDGTKVLSDVNFSATDKAAVDKIGTGSLNTTASTLIGAVNELKASRLFLQNQTFSQSSSPATMSAWTSSGDTNYPYYADLTVSGIDSNWFVELIFSSSDASSGTYAPVCESRDSNIVRIWAISNAAASVTIPTVVAWR